MTTNIAFDQLTVEDRTVLAQTSGMLPVFEDPISMEIMEKAMMTPCGHSFSEDSISSWLQTHKHCPLCNKTLKRNEVLPNYALRTAIAKFITAQKHLQQNIQASVECATPTPQPLNLEDWKVIRVEHNEFEGELSTDSKLLVEIISARELRADWFGNANPYCTVEFDNQKKKSKVVHRTRSPKWEETFVFNIPNSQSGENIVVMLWDKDRILKDRFLGMVLIPLAEVVTTLKMVRRFPLQKKRPLSKKRIRGDVLIRAQFLDLRKSYEMARTDSSSITATTSSNTPPASPSLRHAFSAPVSHRPLPLISFMASVEPESHEEPEQLVQREQDHGQQDQEYDQQVEEQEQQAQDYQHQDQLQEGQDQAHGQHGVDQVDQQVGVMHEVVGQEDAYDEQPLSYYRLRLLQLQQGQSSNALSQLPPSPPSNSDSSSSDYVSEEIIVQPPASPHPLCHTSIPVVQEYFQGEEEAQEPASDLQQDGADFILANEVVEEISEDNKVLDSPLTDEVQRELAAHADVIGWKVEDQIHERAAVGEDDPIEVFNDSEDDGEVEEILHQRRNRRSDGAPSSSSRNQVLEAEQGDNAPQDIVDQPSPFGELLRASSPPPPSDLVSYVGSSRPQYLDVEVDEDDVKFLTEMGFQAHLVQFALKYCDNDVEATLDSLLNHRDKLQLAFLKSSFYS